jgi:hypothetical protein
MATAEKFVPVSDTPAMKAAIAAAAPLVARDAELEQRERRYRRVMEAVVAQYHEGYQSQISEEERLEAEAHYQPVRQERAKLKLELLRHTKAIDAVREQERAKLRAMFRERKRQVVATLKARLLACRASNEELRALQQAEHEMLGEFVERLHWNELAGGDGGRLDQWLRTLKSYGLDE